MTGDWLHSSWGYEGRGGQSSERVSDTSLPGSEEVVPSVRMVDGSCTRFHQCTMAHTGSMEVPDSSAGRWKRVGFHLDGWKTQRQCAAGLAEGASFATEERTVLEGGHHPHQEKASPSPSLTLLPMNLWPFPWVTTSAGRWMLLTFWEC